jgi:hypothetical protein
VTHRASHVDDRVLDATSQLMGTIRRSQDNDRVDLRHGSPPNKVTKGPGSRAAGLAMAFELIESAERRWRTANGPHLVALVRAGAAFRKGVLVETNTKHREVAA